MDMADVPVLWFLVLLYHTTYLKLGLAVYQFYSAPLISGSIQASLGKIQGLFKDFLKSSYSFQGQQVYEKYRFKC